MRNLFSAFKMSNSVFLWIFKLQISLTKMQIQTRMMKIEFTTFLETRIEENQHLKKKREIKYVNSRCFQKVFFFKIDWNGKKWSRCHLKILFNIQSWHSKHHLSTLFQEKKISISFCINKRNFWLNKLKREKKTLWTSKTFIKSIRISKKYISKLFLYLNFIFT